MAATGLGYVARHDGDYSDAIRKNNLILVAVVEALGGLCPALFRWLKYSARRAGDHKKGRDGTKYSRVRPVSFLTHHMRQISSAAVITDAANIEKELTGLKISHAVGAA